MELRAGDFDLDLDSLVESGEYPLLGGSVSSRKADRADLPVEVTLRELWPRTAEIDDRLVIELVIRNTGTDPIFIPASKNFRDVLAPVARGRRQMVFGIEFVPESGFVDKPDPALVISSMAVGAENVPGSMVRLAPGDTLAVRTRRAAFQSEQGKLALWGRSAVTGLVTVKARAYILESFIDDNLVVTKISEPSVSSNELGLVLDLR